MSRLLDIRLLGTVELRLGGTPLPAPESARAVSLLAYCCSTAACRSRGSGLAFLLWPDSSEAQARTNLRKALHTLRRCAARRRLPRRRRRGRWPGAPTRHTGSTSPSSSARSPTARPAGRRRGLRRRPRSTAATTSGSWPSASGCATAAPMRWSSSRGQPDGLEYAERLVRLDPLREAGHRALMRLHAARGDRVRAMRAYHAYAALAQRELGIVPSADAARRLRGADRDAPADAHHGPRPARRPRARTRAALRRAGTPPGEVTRSSCS